MQPYFLPYLGYFDLINQTDLWIIFDTAQYIRHGWMNRNRILHPKEGWQYIQAPLQKHKQTATAREVCVKSGEEWKRRLQAQMEHYRKKAPHYQAVKSFLDVWLANLPVELAQLDTRLLLHVCTWLGIRMDCSYFSDLQRDGLKIGPVNGPGDWALRITEALGGTEYYNPPGGKGLFDPKAFTDAGINLKIQEYTPLVYDTPGYKYEAGLSIIDALMWCTPKEIRDHLDQQKELHNEKV